MKIPRDKQAFDGTVSHGERSAPHLRLRSPVLRRVYRATCLDAAPSAVTQFDHLLIPGLVRGFKRGLHHHREKLRTGDV